MVDQRPRVANVISHPIQHFCPQFCSLAARDAWSFKVFFASRTGLDPYVDDGFNRVIGWDGLDLDFPHVFLNDGQALPIGSNLDAPDLDNQLAEYDPDVVLVYGYSQRLQRRAVRWAKDHNKYVLMLSDSENRQSRAMWRLGAKRLILPRLFGRVDAFLTIGNANEEYYRHYGVPARKLIRSAYPIDVRRYQCALDDRAKHRTAVRRKLGIPEDNIVVMNVGKFVPWKRQEDIVQALRLLDTEPTMAVVLVGSGPMETELKRLSSTLQQHSVIYAGFVQPVALPAFYAAADVYVHASAREPHSVAVSEAVYMGCPVVISDRCGSYGPTDDVRPGRNGSVYRCGDTGELAEALSRLARSPQLRAFFSRNSQAHGFCSQRLAHDEGLRAALIELDLL